MKHDPTPYLLNLTTGQKASVWIDQDNITAEVDGFFNPQDLQSEIRTLLETLQLVKPHKEDEENITPELPPEYIDPTALVEQIKSVYDCGKDHGFSDQQAFQIALRLI